MLAEENLELSKMKAPKGKLRKAQLKNKHKVPDFGDLNANKKKKNNLFGAKKKKKKKKTISEKPLEPNLNRQKIENGNATGIDAALNLMSLTSFKSSEERHPERRAKAAFRSFEEREMRLMREENPGLKRSQLKELIFKRWKKSPENPFNQEHVAYNHSS